MYPVPQWIRTDTNIVVWQAVIYGHDDILSKFANVEQTIRKIKLNLEISDIGLNYLLIFAPLIQIHFRDKIWTALTLFYRSSYLLASSIDPCSIKWRRLTSKPRAAFDPARPEPGLMARTALRHPLTLYESQKITLPPLIDCWTHFVWRLFGIPD